MNRYLTIFLAVVSILILLSDCTQNGGYIGNIFGRWHLERIEADNIEAPVEGGEIYWSFQSDVIKMQRDDGEHYFSVVFGIYRLDNNTLYLNFPEKDGAPFPQTGFPRECKLDVLKLTRSEFILQYHTTKDSFLTYYFRKW